MIKYILNFDIPLSSRYSPKHLYQAAKAGDPEKIIAIISKLNHSIHLTIHQFKLHAVNFIQL